MRNAREIIGLPVIELQEGKSLGRVYNLIFNPSIRKVEALSIGERSLLKARLQQVAFAQVRSFGTDAVTLHSAEAVDGEETADADERPENKLAGRKVVTTDGSFAGTVEDFSFNAASGELADLFLTREKTRGLLRLPVTTVLNFGRDFIIVSEDYLQQAGEVASENGAARQLVHTVEAKAIQFSLNREAGQDIFDDEGTAVIRKGETVTGEVIELARQKNRLVHVLLAAGVGELLEGLDFTREKLDAGSRKLLDAWQSLRNRSQEWMSRRIDDERAGPTGELRELWFQLQSRLSQSSQKVEDSTLAAIREYVRGKTLINPFHDNQGNLLADKGDTITAELVARTGEAGRLPHLFLAAAAGDVQSVLEPIKKEFKKVLQDFQKKD
jgi:uncharacterized protein YrrD